MARPALLLFQIATGDPRPIARQIVDAVRLRVASRELAAGDQLPSVRGLAVQLGINPNTVAKAYAELTAEGWIEARAGLGLFVAAPRSQFSDEERERRLREALVRFVGDVVGLGFSENELLSRLKLELVDLRPPKHAKK